MVEISGVDGGTSCRSKGHKLRFCLLFEFFVDMFTETFTRERRKVGGEGEIVDKGDVGRDELGGVAREVLDFAFGCAEGEVHVEGVGKRNGKREEDEATESAYKSYSEDDN